MSCRTQNIYCYLSFAQAELPDEVAAGTSDEAAAATYMVELLVVESTASENSVAISGNLVAAHEMDDGDLALVGDSYVML
jgi:hypothetical protein